MAHRAGQRSRPANSRGRRLASNGPGDLSTPNGAGWMNPFEVRRWRIRLQRRSELTTGILSGQIALDGRGRFLYPRRRDESLELAIQTRWHLLA